MGQGRILLDYPNDAASKVGIMACKLVCKCGEDVPELPSVKVVSGTEEASTKESIIENQFRE